MFHISAGSWVLFWAFFSGTRVAAHDKGGVIAVVHRLGDRTFERPELECYPGLLGSHVDELVR